MWLLHFDANVLKNNCSQLDKVQRPKSTDSVLPNFWQLNSVWTTTVTAMINAERKIQENYPKDSNRQRKSNNTCTPRIICLTFSILLISHLNPTPLAYFRLWSLPCLERCFKTITKIPLFFYIELRRKGALFCKNRGEARLLKILHIKEVKPLS